MATDLPPRYEIRNLRSEHADWATAILCHTNMFYGPLFTAIHPGQERVHKCLDLYERGKYLIDHQINSGLSFGVFDKEYQFKRPVTSVPTGGKCYWSEEADRDTSSPESLLEQMDFPLVSIALSYDSINPLDLAKMGDLMQVLPEYGEGFRLLILGDERDPASWKATGPGQVLFRNSTSTRKDYEGLGLMKKMAHWLMRWAAEKGFRAIQIEAFNDAVHKVWSNPPSPFKGEVPSTVMTGEVVVEEEDGTLTRPFGSSTQRLTRCYVALK